MTDPTTRPTFRSSAAALRRAAAEAKAEEERPCSTAPKTPPASDGILTPRSASSSAPKGLSGDAAPEATSPQAFGAAPTARLLLPAGAPVADWHAARRAGLGGSDVAAVLGMDRYRSPWEVWQSKTGERENTDNEAMRWGRKLEDLIAQGFAEDSGLVVRPSPGTLQHIEHAWAIANVDRLVVAPSRFNPGKVAVGGPLECKNRSEYQARDWDDDVPDAPALQAHWYMAVGGWSEAWVAALIGGNRLRWHHIDRDQELVDHLVDFLGQWWQRHVVDGVQPDPDGSEATTELLAHLWEAKPDEVAEVDPTTAAELLTRRAALKDRIGELEHELRMVENRLKAQLGDAEIAAHLGRQLYSWKANGNLATTRLTADHPELAAKYRKTVDVPDWGAIAEHHPAIHRAYRARVLRAPSGDQS